MQRVSALLPEPIATQQAFAAAERASGPEPLETRWVDELFARFSRIWGPQFTDRFPNADEEGAWTRIWSRALGGMTGAQIARGLAYGERSRKFPPTSPAEFIDWCKPDHRELGVPGFDQAVAILCSRRNEHRPPRERFEHPMLFAIARDDRLDWFALQRASPSDARKVLLPLYAEYLEDVADGRVFEFPNERALPERITTDDDKARADAAREKCMAVVRNMGKTNGC